VTMPVAPGRNVAILVEVAARNQLLRTSGHHAARRLVERVNRDLQQLPVETEAEPGEDL
jgi:HPr kinase/phosphorylase